MNTGYIHLYYGEGKGKTTAAMGLAARALGHGKKVIIVQFLKKGKSGETESLKKLGAEILAGKAGESFRVSDLTEEERAATREISDDNLAKAITLDCDLLILDELCAAVNNDLADRKLIDEAIKKSEAGTEIVITGRRPPEWLFDSADYITEMRAVRHPHDSGLAAREGIEY